MLKMIEAPDLDTSQSSALMKRLPIIVITVVAVLGAYFLRDYLTFEALAENRESLIAFRDVNYLLTVLVFIAIYTVVVAFSLPGAIILTLAGGFL
ncbi:MAG: putative membrane protein YdjX (TVP38/TMEM64 family), partial [Alteromonas macleodii]